MGADADRALLDALPWGLIVVDGARRVRSANARAADLLGIAAEDVRPDTPLEGVLRTSADPQIAAAVADAIERGMVGPPVLARLLGPPVGDGDDGDGREVDPDLHRILVVPVPGAVDEPYAAVAVERLGDLGDDENVGATLDACLGLVARVRHDANNALMPIFGLAELIRDHPDAPATIVDKAETLLASTGRLRDVLARLNALRRRRPEP